MTHWWPKYVGERFGLKYRFDHAGEGIRMHSHEVQEYEHSTLVLSGVVAIYGPTFDVTVEAGDEAFYDSRQMHEIVALVDGTEIVNIYLRGRPPGYERVSDDKLSGTADVPLCGKLWLQ